MMNINAQKKKGQIHGSINVNLYTDEPMLPDITPEDSGKVLAVDENGEIITEDIPVPESKKYYRHFFDSGANAYRVSFEIIDSSPEPYTKEKLIAFLLAIGANAKTKVYPTSVKFSVEVAPTAYLGIQTGLYATSTTIYMAFTKIGIDANSRLTIVESTNNAYSFTASDEHISEI